MATITRTPTIITDPGPTSLWTITGGGGNDGLQCQHDLASNGSTELLFAQGFGFSEIPDGSIINTMTATVYAKISAAQTNQLWVRMTPDGVIAYPTPGPTPKFELTGGVN